MANVNEKIQTRFQVNHGGVMDNRKTSNQTIKSQITGSCACGNICFQITGELRDVVNCHCDPCRRWTGHFMAGTCAQIENFFFESDSTLTWWNRTEEVKYGFCSNCGSSLFWEDKGRDKTRVITAGVLDPPTHLKTVLNIFSNSASDYHQLDKTIETTSEDLPNDQKADRSI